MASVFSTMVLKRQTSGWSVFFFAALISGFDLQRNDSSVQPESNSELSSDVQTYHPVLQPTETPPTPETYTVKDSDGRTCIRATMGAEYIITEKKTSWYFNLEPSVVRIVGSCGKEEARLSLTLPDSSASLQFTFRTEGQNFYVSELTAHLFLQPPCYGCPKRNYSGSMTHKELFKTANNQSFRCQSDYLLMVSSELRIKLVPLQMQAFSIPSGQYGKENECWADFNKRSIPIIAGSVVVGIILCIVLIFLFIRDQHSGYERL
ncbi:lysosome-associated membrane glycoprotein 3 [Kryptolebias marmoratus]|uniref:lysosome-associated membrane glycoprotein 3 n=1 Tax=Kryptolebias marmoratus TaxID=37003 RepID=UPI0018ACB18D|nr:lysosome-associated membrane glycoprotein 3 [Kryptolebias marmoratus]